MSADNDIGKTKNAPTDAEPQSSPQISEAIDKILANPELIGAVASALGGLKHGAENNAANGEKEESDAVSASAGVPTAELISSLAPMISAMQKTQSVSKGDLSGDRRACLLMALKPYLCRERCEAIDYMVRLGKLSELFRTLY